MYVIIPFMEKRENKENCRLPAVIYGISMISVIFMWLIEFGANHRLSRVELAFFISLVFMSKWTQFNQTSPAYPKITAIFSGICLSLLFLIYIFSSEIKSLIFLYPV